MMKEKKREKELLEQYGCKPLKVVLPSPKEFEKQWPESQPSVQEPTQSDTTEIISPASTYTEFMEWIDQVTVPDVFSAGVGVAVQNDDVFMQELNALIGSQPQLEHQISNNLNDCVQTGTKITYNVEITCACGRKNGFKLTFEPNH
uniref:Uncharacterized protein n=1 Tax=Tetranychus urticae TaxID=32264 RepID=T1KL96_TETUR